MLRYFNLGDRLEVIEILIKLKVGNAGTWCRVSR